MESMKVVRGQVSSVVDIDFFLGKAHLETRYEDDRIAEVIKGPAYGRTKQRINDFIGRCEQTLAGLQGRVDQTRSEFDSLLARAKSAEPGGPPSSLFVSRSDHNSVARFNEKVEKYNNQLELHRRIIDQANRAKERYEDAVEKFNEKKADLEEQIRVKLEELKPALDQDILTLLGKMQQLAYDNIHNKSDLLAGFLLAYLAKRAYVFLYDRIDNTAQQHTATDIFTKLNDELDTIMSSGGDSVEQGLHQAAEFLRDCHQKSATIFQGIQQNLEGLPYRQCSDTEEEIRGLLALPFDTAFEYKHIIDPAELARVEEKVRARKAMLEAQVVSINAFASRFDPTFNMIATIREFAAAELAKMNDHKTGTLDPVGSDIFFALGVFDDEEQERYLKKHKQWLQDVQKKIESALNIDLTGLVRTVIGTELLTRSAREVLAADQAFLFYSHKESLSRKKDKCLEGIKTLDSILREIDELPRQKAQAFSKKMSLWLNVSLLPLINVGVLFPIVSMIREYLPALASRNGSYVEMKQAHIRKFQTYFSIHIALMLTSCGGLLLVAAPGQSMLGIVAVTYVVSTFVFYLKRKQLMSC